MTKREGLVRFEVRQLKRGKRRKQPYGRIFTVTHFQPVELLGLEGTDSGGSPGRYRRRFPRPPRKG